MSILDWISQESRMKKEIRKRAEKLTEELYAKEVMFKSLEASDFNFAILQDLMRTARMTGRVVVKFKDGTEVTILSSDREALNRSSEELY